MREKKQLKFLEINLKKNVVLRTEKKKIYIICFSFVKKENVYISCLKLNPEYIPNMKFSGFTQLCKNISIDNFIDNKIGNVKLYKSKKRLELRLCKDIINNNCSIKLY